MSWILTTLGEITNLRRGYDLPKDKRQVGVYPVYSSSGITGTNNKAAVSGPCVITGRYGTVGKVFYSGGACWPLNTTLYTTDLKDNDPRFIYHLLKTIPWNPYTTASAVPGINRNHINSCPVRIPSLSTQKVIARILDSLDSKIELNKRTNDYLAAHA